MNDKSLETILALRAQLHDCAEVSGQEVRTKALLKDFLAKNTSLELHDCGQGFYAARREEYPSKPAIALRADYDALATAEKINPCEELPTGAADSSTAGSATAGISPRPSPSTPAGASSTAGTSYAAASSPPAAATPKTVSPPL